MEIPPLQLTVDVSDDAKYLLIGFTRPVEDTPADRKITGKIERESPSTWVGTINAYKLQASIQNIEWLTRNFPQSKYTPEANITCRSVGMLLQQAQMRTQMVGAYLDSGAVPKITDYQFKRPAMGHQVVAFECGRRSPFLGLLMQMGTGKTFVMNNILNYQAMSFRKREKRPMRVLIMCPRAVLINWVRELAMDLTVDYKVGIVTWFSSRYREELKSLNVVAIGGGNEENALKASLELISNDDCDVQITIANYDVLKSRLDLLKMYKFDMLIADESHYLKSMTAKRTKFILELAETCQRRYIMTGSPLTQSPNDLFSQFEFLGPQMGLLGYTTYHAFKTGYADYVKTKYGEKVDRWVNLGKLLTEMSKWSFTIKKEQCLDLPPKVYEPRAVQMTEQQQEIYDQVASEVLVVLESLGAEVTVQNILVQYLRLAQVTSGYIKSMDGKEVEIPDGGVKIDAMLEVLEHEGYPKTVVWSRFHNEIAQACKRMDEVGIKYVQYHGGVSADQRQANIDAFTRDPDVKVFIGTQSAGGVGINLTTASLMIYLSNSFSLGDRLQSEDRVHRIGQKKSVTYVDLLVENSIDELVHERLGKKRDMANFFNDPGELLNSLKDFLLGGLSHAKRSA